MSTFYAPELQLGALHYQLSEEESKHCIKVLRLQQGAEIELINGKGLQAMASLQDAHPKRSILQIEQFVEHAPTASLHVAMAPTKNLDRLEWFVEKATELGITHLSFLLCDHSERRQLNIERLEKIAIAAIKQSKRFYLPQISQLQRFDEYIASAPKGYFGHCGPGSKMSMKSLQKGLPFLIGPEGDFSSREIELALACGFQAIDMSPFRLRTETAALLATTALMD